MFSVCIPFRKFVISVNILLLFSVCKSDRGTDGEIGVQRTFLFRSILQLHKSLYSNGRKFLVMKRRLSTLSQFSVQSQCPYPISPKETESSKESVWRKLLFFLWCYLILPYFFIRMCSQNGFTYKRSTIIKFFTKRIEGKTFRRINQVYITLNIKTSGIYLT